MPKYSIVIPCLNSIQFISKTLPLILKNTYSDFEIVVSDNLSADGTFEFLSSISDPRLVVVRPDKRLSMHEHYEFALFHASGEWVNLLGADDFSLPSAFSKMDELTSEFPSVEIITWDRSYFFWPGVEDIYGDIRLSYTESKAQRTISSRKTLLFGLLGQEQILDLPQLYTCSFISASLIEAVRENGRGRFYTDSIPDIYSSVELLLASSSFIKIAHPLTLVGSSKASLGIGDRIYLDHQMNNSTKKSLLSEKTDKELHVKKISPYFLLDCYLSYAVKHSIQARRFFIILALTGVAGELLKRKVLLQNVKLLRKATRLLDIPIAWLSLALLLSLPNLSIRLVREFQRKASRRLMRRYRKDWIKIHAVATSKLVGLEQALEVIAEVRSKNL
jgi:glycosyltransferase involved in cell wall biosynthesis